MLYELYFAGFVLRVRIQKFSALHARGRNDEIRSKWKINI